MPAQHFILLEHGAEAVERIRAQLEEHGAAVLEDERVGSTARFTVRYEGDLQALSYALEHAATLVSIGESLDIVKDVGGAHDVDETYHVAGFTGTHGIGHVRLATESDVTPDRSPILAKTPVPGLYVNCGWGTGGFKATPGSGHVFAHTIANDNPHPINAPFTIERFRTGRLIDEAAAAAVAH